MKTLLVNIWDDNQKNIVEQLLNKVEGVSVEEIEDSIYNDLEDEDVVLLNERLIEYESHPEKTISLEDFKNNLKLKYGL
jgi:hypothetical protein